MSSKGNSVTLSGLLNALDGVTAGEGRFVTTYFNPWEGLNGCDGGWEPQPPWLGPARRYKTQL